MKLASKTTALSICVGDAVKTEFYPNAKDVVRKVTRVEHDSDTGSTVRIWADDGGICDCCKRPMSQPIDGVDGAWFIPAKKRIKK